jgi:spermidine synthase
MLIHKSPEKTARIVAVSDNKQRVLLPKTAKIGENKPFSCPDQTMYKYNGRVIHQTQDEHGLIEVVENNGERVLHFGTSSRQSSQLLNDPNALNSLYAQAMMAVLLFNEQPRHPLLIGLGGGTLAKFFLHQFPDIRLSVVEFRAEVLKVARSHFSLPLDQRMKIKIGCGAQHVGAQSREFSALHDAILVDAFDPWGMAEEVSSQAFFDDCLRLLTADGVLVINLWGTDKDLFQKVSWNMGRAFDWRMVFLPVRGRGNIIGFAFPPQRGQFSYKALQSKAETLLQQYQLDYPLFLYDFRRNNPSVFHRVFKG